MQIRSSKGSQLAEFPIALIVLLCFVFFTLADVSTIVLGFSAVHSAARNAASDAARAAGWDEMQARAKSIVTALSVGAVTVDNVDIGVFQVPIKKTVTDEDGNAETLSTSQILPGAVGAKTNINTQLYQYQTQVTVTARVAPLVTLQLPGMVDVPGVGAPVPVTAKYTCQTENPKALSN